MIEAPDAWGLAGIAAKWALYLGSLGAAGTVLCTLVFGLDKTRGLAVSFALLGLIGAGASFMLKGVALTGEVWGMVDLEMLGLLWSTQSGTALRLQILGLALLVVGLAFARAGLWAAALGAGIALASFGVIGHVSDRGALALRVVLLLHLLGVAGWMGVLTPLRRLALQDHRAGDAAELGQRFGRMALIGVPVLILAGAILAYMLVGSIGALFGTPYGLVLLAKVGCLGILLGFAAANKLRFVPQLISGDPAAGRRLARSIWFEWALILVILALTATLTSWTALPT